MRGLGRQPIEAELIDLSVYGCRLTTDATYTVGDKLWLRFAGGQPVSATAIWFESGQIGCRFDEALDRGLFRALTLQL